MEHRLVVPQMLDRLAVVNVTSANFQIKSGTKLSQSSRIDRWQFLHFNQEVRTLLFRSSTCTIISLSRKSICDRRTVCSNNRRSPYTVLSVVSFLWRHIIAEHGTMGYKNRASGCSPKVIYGARKYAYDTVLLLLLQHHLRLGFLEPLTRTRN